MPSLYMFQYLKWGNLPAGNKSTMFQKLKDAFLRHMYTYITDTTHYCGWSGQV